MSVLTSAHLSHSKPTNRFSEWFWRPFPKLRELRRNINGSASVKTFNSCHNEDPPPTTHTHIVSSLKAQQKVSVHRDSLCKGEAINGFPSNRLIAIAWPYVLLCVKACVSGLGSG